MCSFKMRIKQPKTKGIAKVVRPKKKPEKELPSKQLIGLHKLVAPRGAHKRKKLLGENKLKIKYTIWKKYSTLKEPICIAWKENYPIIDWRSNDER